MFIYLLVKSIRIKKIWAQVLSLIVSILFFCTFASAQTEEEIRILRMFYEEEELVITPTRTPKPISQIAENITVITAEDIEDMNAHTLTDVLNTIPGIQMDIRGGPGSEANPHIQGSEFRHVLVVIDGVTLNNLSDNYADLSAMPVQNIERIEIVKGPASSSWGSSLGGIINIITKPVDEERNAGGTVSVSRGEEKTGDYRAEASGRTGSIGYYIYAGNLISDGLRPNTGFYENNLYTKLKLDINEKADLTFTFGYNKGSRGRGELSDYDLSYSTGFEYLFSTLSLNYAVTDEVGLNLSLRTSKKNVEHFIHQLSTGDELVITPVDDSSKGSSAKFTLKKGIHNMVFGADYDNGKLESGGIADERQDLEKWAIFSNDTIVLFEKLSITPGLRFDHTNTNGDFLSPSFGITYILTENTILRAYTARGFNIPPLAHTFATSIFFVPNPDLEMEKVWSYQAGVESTALEYFWLKTTLFRHDISDAITSEQLPSGNFTFVNKEKQRRQGIEVEIQTKPVYNTSVSAGFVFVDAKDGNTDERLPDIPRHTYDIGIQYNDNNSFKALLKGRYVWWNARSLYNGKYNSFIWDLNLMKRIYRNNKRDVELFLTAHNIFNGSQYLIDAFKNPQRWVEAGMRLKF